MEVIIPNPTRSHDLWFPDGSLVLQAESVLFKVYAGILARASPVFRSMISMPQPCTAGTSDEAEQPETYEGCPLVVMAGDSAEDVHAFLKALHDSR